MSKLLRSELKSIVKECLVEILSEGLLGNNNKSFMKESHQNLDSFNKKTKKADWDKRTYLNKI